MQWQQRQRTPAIATSWCDGKLRGKEMETAKSRTRTMNVFATAVNSCNSNTKNDATKMTYISQEVGCSGCRPPTDCQPLRFPASPELSAAVVETRGPFAGGHHSLVFRLIHSARSTDTRPSWPSSLAVTSGLMVELRLHPCLSRGGN